VWSYLALMRRSRGPDDAAILRQAPPTGPGWVYARFGRRTYEQRRLGFRKYDLAMSAEDDVVVLHTGWRFVGFRRQLPLVETLAEGWVPRPAELHRC
jgi:hypothetical protein